VFIEHSFKITMFSKSFLERSWLYDFLRCMSCFTSLEEVWRSMNAIGSMHSLNPKTVCLTH
jgi:hypothetical protein